MPLRLRTVQQVRLTVRSLGPVRMNLDDLADVRDLLRDRTSNPPVVSVGRYDVDDISDLVHASDNDLALIQVSTNPQTVQVLITPDGARVWTQSDDQRMTVLVEDVASQVNSLPLSWRISYPWFIVAIAIAFVGISSAACIPLMIRHEPAAYGGYVAILGGIFWFLWRLPKSWRQRGAVEFIPLARHEVRTASKSFTQSVTLSIISALLGAALGAAIASIIGG